MIDRSLNYGRNHFHRFLQQCNYSNVLDLGAGRGHDLEIARQINPDARLIAFEIFSEFADVLRRMDIEVHAVDIERDVYPLDDESIDVIITNQTLEHTKDLFWIMHESLRVLKTDGHLIIGIPNLAAWHNRLLLLLGRQPSCMQLYSGHIRGFTRRGLVRFMAEVFPNGLEYRGSGGGNFYPFPAKLAKPLSTVLPNLSVGLVTLFKKTRPYEDSCLRFPVERKLRTNFYLG